MRRDSTRKQTAASQQVCLWIFFLIAVAVAIPPAQQPCGDPAAGPVLGGIDLVAAAGGLGTTGGTVGTLLEGSPNHAVQLGSYSFWFVSAEHAMAFTTNVDRFVPRYGGFCGVAMTGHDDCCSPAAFCLGPTCVHRESALRSPSFD